MCATLNDTNPTPAEDEDRARRNFRVQLYFVAEGIMVAEAETAEVIRGLRASSEEATRVLRSADTDLVMAMVKVARLQKADAPADQVAAAAADVTASEMVLAEHRASYTSAWAATREARRVAGVELYNELSAKYPHVRPASSDARVSYDPERGALVVDEDPHTQWGYHCDPAPRGPWK